MAVHPSQRNHWPDRWLLVALLLAGSLAMSRNLADADLWGHVTFGMNVIADRQIPASATYTFTAVNYPWVNHENLSEVTFALLTRLGGGPALLIFKFLLGLTVLAMMVHAARRQGAGAIAVCLVVVLVAVNLSSSWTIRPQLFSYGLFALMILLLDSAFAKFHEQGEFRSAYLWAVLPLLLIWANAHGGFVAGYALFALYLICRGGELLIKFRRPGAIWRLALIAFCGALVTLINPYGPELHLWLMDAMSHPWPEITEWGALGLKSDLFIPFVAICALTTVALLKTKQRRDVTQIILLSVTAWQAVMHTRHVPFFAILVGFWLPQHVESLLQRRCRLSAGSVDLQQADHPARSGSRRLCLAMVATAALLAVVLGWRLSALRVDKTEFPVDAIHFMARNDLHGRLVVTYNWAQYALAALGPETTVAFDGRFSTCYPQSIIDMHFDFVLGDIPELRWRSPASGPVDGRRVLYHRSPDLALIDRSQAGSVRTLESDPQWVLLYQDRIAQVWGRADRYDDWRSSEYLSPELRRIGNELPEGFADWPAIPAASRRSQHADSRLGGFPRSHATES